MRGSFKRFCQNIKCVEVGVEAGDNAINMLTNLPFAQFVLVDSYDVLKPTFQFNARLFTKEEREAFINKVRERLKPFDGRVQLIVEDSAIASIRFSDNYFDYIYIDAEHDNDSVFRDLSFWYPKLKVGGIMAGHDAGLPGVDKALLKFFGSGWIGDSEDWYLVKK